MARIADCRKVVSAVYGVCLKEATPEQKEALARMYQMLRNAFSSKRAMRGWVRPRPALRVPMHAQPGFDDLPLGGQEEEG